MLDRWALCAMLPQLPPLSFLRAPSHVLSLSKPFGKKIRNTFLPCMNPNRRPTYPPRHSHTKPLPPLPLPTRSNPYTNQKNHKTKQRTNSH
ncbi:hypothetical protein BT69DRAFT_1282982 [Atractiella rhizophila]|nr:hypothetical protein BT69DRAFT_1282982 [Atractiella rhizophila]